MLVVRPESVSVKTWEAMQMHDKKRDSELLGGILFDQVDGSELQTYVGFIRRCLECHIQTMQLTEQAGGLMKYVSMLESRLENNLERQAKLNAALTDHVDSDELLDAFSTEDRQLLRQSIATAQRLQREIECFRALEKRDLGFSGSDGDRLVAKVTFFYFLSCSPDLQDFAFRTHHPERPESRACLDGRKRIIFLRGLKQVAERYANHELNGPQFVLLLQNLYTFGTASELESVEKRNKQ